MGVRGLPPFWTIGWSFLFDLDDPNPGGPRTPQPSRLIDTKLASALSVLPSKDQTVADERSLARRNLLRGRERNLPSGGRVARAMNVTPLTIEELGFDRPRPAPLWFYIFKETEVRNGGTHLGPVGGRIVAETFLGLLRADRLSYLSVQPSWTPELPCKTPGDFTMASVPLWGARRSADGVCAAVAAPARWGRGGPVVRSG